jgi:hypothetical protein
MNISEEIKKINLKRLLIGVVLGAFGGFAYYYFIGCSSGSCPLTSNPYLMTVWGVFFGGVLFFKQNKE